MGAAFVAEEKQYGESLVYNDLIGELRASVALADYGAGANDVFIRSVVICESMVSEMVLAKSRDKAMLWKSGDRHGREMVSRSFPERVVAKTLHVCLNEDSNAIISVRKK